MRLYKKYIFQFESSFYQSPICPTILQLKKKSTTQFDQQNKQAGFYMFPTDTEIPKPLQNIGSK